MSSSVNAHEISFRPLIVRGVIGGLVAAVIAGLISMAVGAFALNTAGIDAWTFPKTVAALVMGPEAVSPATGFDLAPVLVGIITHLAIGAFFGLVFATMIGFFDINDSSAVMVSAIVFAGVLVVFTYVGSSAVGERGGLYSMRSALGDLYLVTSFVMHLVWALTLGGALANWGEKFDLGERPVGQRFNAGGETYAFAGVAALGMLGFAVAVLTGGEAIVWTAVVGAMVVAALFAVSRGLIQRRSHLH